MDDRAPDGKKWYCMQCGKTALSLSSEQRGWDESCAMNAILIDLMSIGPSHEQTFEFHRRRDAAIGQNFDAIQKLTEQIRRREVPEMSPALGALAERAAASLQDPQENRDV